MMERVKKEVDRRTAQVVNLILNYGNVMKAINCRVITVTGYILNAYNLLKGDFEELDKSVKAILRDKGIQGKQAGQIEVKLTVLGPRFRTERDTIRSCQR